MKENWTKQMKQKLEGHKMAPPAGLWEDISREMAIQSAPVVASKATVGRRWYWVAAAAVLAIVGFFAFYQFDTNEPQLVADNEKVITTNASDGKMSMPEEAPTLLARMELQLKKPQVYQQRVPASIDTQETIDENLQESSDDIPQDITDESQLASDAPKVQVSHEKKQTHLPEVVDPKEMRSKSGDSDKWTIGLNGSNGLLTASNNIGNPMNSQLLNSDAYSLLNSEAFYGAKGFSFTNGISFVELTALPDVVSKHKVPLRIALSLQYQLNNRLALHGGISYAYLESEFKIPLANDYSYTQKLKYLGIPLGASWYLWSSGSLHVYLAGTALLEKCINAEVTNGDIDRHPWQFSLNASAGAEYHFTRQLGVYLEPSLGYYFDDGSSLEHYYKEHPLAPSLQFGLRLHLK